MSSKYTMMSLFSGSGGFELAATMCGIEPVYASEVEPYPIAVTRSRFPNMKHLGDVSKINGAEIEPVDVITFGSPCQDLSVAGKRAGLKHEANGDDETTRSGLFMEAVRIIKEMREATNGVYPNFIIWENVPGAFSSNKGEDFRIVLEEIIKIAEPSAVMPSVPKGGWAYADSYCGDGWALAYRVFDAQYWGVPQRRRRIYLVADFRGQRAQKILFECSRLRGHFEAGRTPWQTAAADAERSTSADDRAKERLTSADADLPFSAGFKAGNGAKAAGIGWEEEIAPTLAAVPSGTNQVPSVCIKKQYLFENHSQDARYKGPLDVCPMLPAHLGTGGNNTPFVVGRGVPFCKSARPKSADDATVWKHATVANTLNTFDVGEVRANELVVMASPTYAIQGSMIGRADKNGPQGDGVNEETSFTLNTIDRHAVAYADESPVVLDRAFFNQGANAQYDPQFYTDGTVPTLVARGPSAVQVQYIVRRLTPTECARLQGFVDAWGHIEPKDTLTDEEYRFYHDVRNTHAAINGKAVKEYTPKQMLAWYNKLWTDSAEYKLWGNGIALPCALYVMQGIEDALKGRDRQ